MSAAGSGLLAGVTLVTLLAGATAARAEGADMIVTGGGGLGGVHEQSLCLDGADGCAGGDSGAMLLGVGIADVSSSGVRGALRVEGTLAYGQRRGHHVDLLAAVGWEGERLIVEAGLGGSLMWTANEGTREPGGVLHSGLGVRLNRATAILARADYLTSETLTGMFLGLALEWQPYRH
jgi:hypothetical protein